VLKQVQLIFLFILLFGIVHAQSNSKIDSLKKELNSVQNDTLKVKHLNSIASAYRISGDLNTAKKYLDSAFYLLEKSHWKYGEALTFNNLAYVNIYDNDFESAMKNAVSALQISESNADKENLGFAYLYIGYVKLTLGEQDEALSYYNKSLNIRKELKNDYNLGYSYTYLGNYYNINRNYDSSLYYHSLALITRLKTGDTRSIADSYLLIGSSLFKQKEYADALHNYDYALKKYEQLNDSRRLAEIYRNYAEVYLYQDELDSASVYLSKSLEIAKNIGAIDNLIPIYFELANLHEKKGDYKNAYQYIRKHIQYKDSTANNDVFREVTKQILKYKTEKENKIKELKYQNEKALQKKNKAILIAKNKMQQYILFGAIALILILISIAFVIARTLKITRSQKTVIEEQTKEIVASITYAKRIQNAILPTTEYIAECLPDSFIYYNPKDIVAGDFYWVDRQGDNVIFAAADCTGHGVPGAMVSVVCHNAMDRSIREHKLIEPNEILNKTREIVVDQLNKAKNKLTDPNEKIRDGMDIALCNLNTTTNQLKFAGAYNPLWIIRNGKNKVEEIKANRQSIGDVENPISFDMHSVKLEEGDTLYLFSDGFVDQFGGGKGKKYKSANFKKLLLKIQDKSMDQQKEIIHTEFEKWQGPHEQIDDVCVFGVRI